MKSTKSVALIAVALLMYSTGAAAQLTNHGVLDQVIGEFSTRASAWQAVIMSAATWLFWTLGTISLVWTFGFMALRRADLGEFFAEFIRFCLFFGFFLWLLRNGPAMADSIIRSLRQIGDTAAGTAGLTPSSIVDIGFMIFKRAIQSLSVWSPIDSFVGVLLSAGILILLAVIAVNMLLLLISGWILMYAGIFFLGFGGSRWTSDMAINYYKTVLGVGVQLLAMTLLVGIGTDLLGTFYAKMSKGSVNFEELGVMLVVCLALWLLASRIPPLLAGIISGGSVGAVGAGSFGAAEVAGAALGAAGTATAAAGMAGTATMAAAQNVAGGASAVTAAVSKASENMANGTGMFASAGAWSSGAPSSSSGSSPLASVMGGSSPGAVAAGGMKGALSAAGKMASTAGKFAADVGANLAKGASEVAKAKATETTQAAGEQLDATIGGQVAAAIRASDTPLGESTRFDGDSLGPTAAAHSTDDEVAAFVNKHRQPQEDE